MLNKIGKVYGETALIKLIICGLIVGILIALFAPPLISVVKVFGAIFVSALKAVAPILVFVLVINALSQKAEPNSVMKPIIKLYVIGTFCASLVAVTASFLFPVTLHLQTVEDASITPPSGIVEVLQTVIMNGVDNPVHALTNANYIGILVWSVMLGLALRKAGPEIHSILGDLAKGVTQVV